MPAVPKMSTFEKSAPLGFFSKVLKASPPCHMVSQGKQPTPDG
jgi:hypothetical protein